MLRLARLMRGRSEGAYYRAAGQHLAHLRRRTDRETWIDLVRRECQISPRRAYELMEIAAGTKSLKEQRFAKAKRVRKARKRQQKSKQNQT